MTIEAIAVDIDGTITDDTRKICISAIEALRKAEKAGIPTVIVTGNVVNYVGHILSVSLPQSQPVMNPSVIIYRSSALINLTNVSSTTFKHTL